MSQGDVSSSLGVQEGASTARLDQLVDRGLCKRGGTGLRLTSEGRAHLSVLLAREAAAVDRQAATALYDRFCELNQDLKQVITDWQLRDGHAPNDHSDPAYDAAVLARLTAAYERAGSLLAELGTLRPRLQHYSSRLALAHARVLEGDHSFVATIGKDSFHTLWFELHEDLIGLTGASRVDEAIAGRAT
ncbi:hypothetical protein BJF78_07200 [Pseudonocardia sp. CNS-139]|nr:hypothetical protein BJF78_07200 [Pseudonocardia sp. CNS-139]